ncbi:MAG: acetolactate decarboxylase [bacterium]|nr:acetolactate decarboxylase [bacterium]
MPVKYTNLNAVDTDTLTQISTTSAIIEGVLETNISVEELKEWGNFGIGGTAGFGAGINILDNSVYLSENINDSEPVSFCLLTNFISNKYFPLKPCIKLSDIHEIITSNLPSQDIMYAIRIEGEFEYIRITKSVKHFKPYKRITDSVCDMAKSHEITNIKGTLMGFWLPEFLKEINSGAGGSHMHFLSEDKSFSGYVTNCLLRFGDMHISYKHNLNLVLPNQDLAFDQAI